MFGVPVTKRWFSVFQVLVFAFARCGQRGVAIVGGGVAPGDAALRDRHGGRRSGTGPMDVEGPRITELDEQ